MFNHDHFSISSYLRPSIKAAAPLRRATIELLGLSILLAVGCGLIAVPGDDGDGTDELSGAAMSFGDAGFEPDLAVLADRIDQARILGEHHVWEAAKALALIQSNEAVGPASRRLETLMDADALVDAVLLIVGLAEPRRSIGSISHGAGRWTCTLRCERDGMARSVEAEHVDLAAALLASLLRSYQPGCYARPMQSDEDPQTQ